MSKLRCQAAPPITILLILLVVLGIHPAHAQNSGEPIPLSLENRVDFVTRSGVVSFCTHYARDARSRQVGLMFQTRLPDDAGMLFDFQLPQPVSMWMLNTVLSLDMIFITADHRILRIEEKTTPFSREIISSGGLAQYVLEVNAGKARENNLQKGDRVFFAEEEC